MGGGHLKVPKLSTRSSITENTESIFKTWLVLLIIYLD